MEQKDKNLFITIGLVAIVVVALVFLFWKDIKRTIAYSKAVYTLSDSEAILILDFDGQKEEGQRWFKGEVIEGMTLLNTLQAASLAGDFDVGANSHVSEIDDVASTANKRWICYLNDQEIQQSLSETQIKPKDRIVCKYK